MFSKLSYFGYLLGLLDGGKNTHIKYDNENQHNEKFCATSAAVNHFEALQLLQLTMHYRRVSISKMFLTVGTIRASEYWLRFLNIIGFSKKVNFSFNKF